MTPCGARARQGDGRFVLRPMRVAMSPHITLHRDAIVGGTGEPPPASRRTGGGDGPPAPLSPSRRLGANWDSTLTPWVPGSARLVVAGGWHGNATWAARIVASTADHGVRTIVHVGDLGVLMPGRLGRGFTLRLEQALEQADVRLVLVDGNHDSHARLRWLPVEPATGSRRIGQRLWWSGRGTRWSWAGRSLGALSGAYSVDRPRRTEGFDLWADLEEPTAAERDLLGDEQLDVLFTHEAPDGVQLSSILDIGPRAQLRSRESRILVRTAIERTRPSTVFHGHWHPLPDSNRCAPG